MASLSIIAAIESGKFCLNELIKMSFQQDPVSSLLRLPVKFHEQLQSGKTLSFADVYKLIFYFVKCLNGGENLMKQFSFASKVFFSFLSTSMNKADDEKFSEYFPTICFST